MPAVAGERPLLFLDDPGLLASLEAEGLDLGRRVFGVASGTTQALRAESPRGFHRIAATIERDLAEVRRQDPQAGTGMRYVHRLFDTTWLSSPHTRFELVAVVNRLDRDVFHPGSCGELRLIYRLAYTRTVRGERVESRLPMTLNAVFWLPKDSTEGGCRGVIDRLRAPAEGADAARLLAPGGALDLETLGPAALESVEINLQSVRWPSTIRPDLGGHAEYILRVFTPGPRGLTPAPLENTPDVAKVRRDRRLRAELVATLRSPDALAAIDAGTFVLEERFLAQRATSVAPHGLARRVNRPYTTLLTAAELAELPLEGRQTIASPAALLRRLDGLSCQGCHQSRSVAGFHVLGRAKDPSDPTDALHASHSDHAKDELIRRRRELDARRSDQPVDRARPPAELGDGGYASRCGLGDPGFAQARCRPELTCTAVDDRELGLCLPNARAELGDPCQLGAVIADERPHRDRIPNAADHPCGPGRVCEVAKVGFPNGMCAASCDDLGHEGTCGAIALLGPFNACLARGEPFPACLQLTRPAGLRACDAQRPCREDYVCAQMPGGRGACLPPYFLFQLRVDGHRPG